MNIISRLKGRFRYGFTLIELLLVIGIIAILASIVIVAINPTKQLGDARNAQRRSDVNTILNAVYQYAIDNNGSLPSSIPTGADSADEICTSAAALAGTCGDTTGTGVSLNVLTGSYLVDIPSDPQATGIGTDYTIYKDAQGRVTVSATGENDAGTISVTR